jgi:hypothetical protein
MPRSRWCLAQLRVGPLVLLALSVALASGLANGAESAKPLAPSAKPAGSGASALDQELLKDLDNELLDGVQNLPAGKKPAADKARFKQDSTAPGEPGKPAPEKPLPDDEKMGEDIGEGPEDPLMRIGQEMRKVEQLIERQKSANPSEPLRQQIVKELSQLIDQLEQQQQQQQSSSKSKASQSVASRESVKQSKQSAGKQGTGQANQPARDSSERLGRNDVQRPDMDQMKGMMKDLWGQLPAHAREQMLQTSPEQFVPRYELQIEKYYKRLAEQQKHEP